jgi:hypothetical protein
MAPEPAVGPTEFELLLQVTKLGCVLLQAETACADPL